MYTEGASSDGRLLAMLVSRMTYSAHCDEVALGFPRLRA
jgi:hypothetical protein